MKTLNDVKNELNNIQFNGFSNCIKMLLGIFNVSDNASKRIIFNAEKDLFRMPIYVYKRAVIICKADHCNNIPIVDSINNAPVVIVLSPSYICIHSEGLPDVKCKFGELGNYALNLSPLSKQKGREKDIYETLDFAALVYQLKNRISQQQKDDIDIPKVILDIIYISISGAVVNNNHLDIFKWHDTQSDHRLLFQSICISIGIDSDFIPTEELFKLEITDEIYRLISKIFHFNIAMIDANILGSLLYKLIDQSASISIMGHQNSYVTVEKLIEPLFVERFAQKIANLSSTQEASEIASELQSLVFFDPTNNPGSFLCAAMQSISNLLSDIRIKYPSVNIPSISMSNYIALVSNDFAAMLTRLTLWFTYIQYLISCKQHLLINDVVKVCNSVAITNDNQLEANWNAVCENNGKVHILGSPLFKGYNKLNDKQKRELKAAYNSAVSSIDYSSGWLVKAAEYIKNSSSKASFILTNSICQGEQVKTIWKTIFSKSCGIEFAYRPFKWRNIGSDKVEVTVVIIGISDKNTLPSELRLIDTNYTYKCSLIGPYLLPDNDVIVSKASSVLSKDLPKMRKGNMPYEGQKLMFNWEQKNQYITTHPNIKSLIKRLFGSKEYINGIPRYCFWIPDDHLDFANSIPCIAKRIEAVREVRAMSTAHVTTKNRPHQFREFIETKPRTQTLIVPSVSSENREYIPMGFVFHNTIISNLAFAVYDCEIWLLAVLTSKIHQVWVDIVCGKLESRNRYSNKLGYNTFPFPKITELQKNNLSNLALELIQIREEFCDKSLGVLYSDMPPKLKNIHKKIDTYVDSCYQQEPFESNVDRLSLLFRMYNLMMKQNEN